jgi:hypothetical protein
MNPLRRTFADAPRLTRARVIAALCIAAAADGLQLLLLPFAWTFVESAIDVVAMILTIAIIGFHPLLLPTFVIEFLPVVDALPTWTGCVAAVLVLRRRSERTDITVTTPPPESSPPPPLPPPLPPAK